MALFGRTMIKLTAVPRATGFAARESNRWLSLGSKIVRSPVDNPNLRDLDADYLYHLGLSSDQAVDFSDVKFFCSGGSAQRMTVFANQLADELNLAPVGLRPTTIGKTDRYSTFKVGPVLISSHGMGQASYSILLHEVTKLLNYAGAEDVAYFRMGSSGGLGVPPGTVVVTTEGVNGEIESNYKLPVLGKVRSWPTQTNESLRDELAALSVPHVQFGKTMSTDCFYEGQGRLDGALCDYENADKMAFLTSLTEYGVKNIEMEAAMFCAFCNRLGIRGAIACVTLLNRMEGDQVTTPPEVLASWDERPAELVTKYIKSKLEKS